MVLSLSKREDRMHTKSFVYWMVVFLTLSLASLAYADEGMWMLDQLNQLPLDKMKAAGLELSSEQIYKLKDAVVRVGASGAFVSPDGLILTNHHVAFGAIQRQSSLEANFIEDGFLAKSREEELPAIGYDVYITKDFKDVTAEILSAVNDTMSYFERYKAIEDKKRELIAACEKDQPVRCEVVAAFGGAKYYLFTYDRIQDVRLVYAPPRSIGEFGGDIDNWMWPRHAGDFSLFRAYVAPDGSFAKYAKENVPYKPKVYLPISTKGYKDGTFTMIMGYPRSTLRYRSSYSIEVWQNFIYPFQIDMAETQLDVLEAAARADPELAIKFAGRIKGINNRLKYNRGIMEGLRKSKILQRKLEKEAEFKEFLSEHPDLEKKYGDILTRIGEVHDELKTYIKKQLMMGSLIYGSELLGLAYTIYKWGIEKTKKDEEREPQYQDRNIPLIKERIEIAQRNLDVQTDMVMLEMLINKAADLPAGQKIEVIEKVVQGKTGKARNKAIKKFVQHLYKHTKVDKLDERLKMFDMTVKQLKERNDAFINFAAALEKEFQVIDKRSKAFNGAISKLRPQLIQAMYEWKKVPLYPDANRTIRFTYGQVKGYAPRDAVYYNYVTTLKGVIEKDKGEYPFDVPECLKELEQNRNFGNYADVDLGDIPVNFLSTNDITGGNSGSPVLNGKGELIGVAFDGNWESMTSDYQYDSNLTRAINVDVRYILFILDKVAGATNILDELDIR